MPVGECTITLQDVEVLVGLPTDGEPVIEFHELANDADEETITRYAWAYILQLMGGSIFADKSTRYMHLIQLCKASKQGVREIAGPLILLQIWAWERFPIVAPQLLHVNANQLHGRAYGSRWRDQFCVTRSATHVVSQYRYMFDLLQPSQIVWEPYKTVIDSLPHFCTNGHNIWRTISPLICFYIGEWHHPDRVLRQ
ncbi:serine/threonine-protein phosphatase 7 long form homolog [Cucumis melo]|uniref:Serine/threonine-protein phosphatase 7 long form homolog n=1 Tax=Cucumis melo TaxID=3656 RepID=A0ABM3KLA3_CUCME|nr:serine/threonine-protein phosphatase 7 long form homolog [Cucumis melo]